MRGDDITAGGGCAAHCAVRRGSSGTATGKFWGSREQPGAGRRLGGGVEWACRRAESVNTASIALQGMGQRLVAVSALLVQAVLGVLVSVNRFRHSDLNRVIGDADAPQAMMDNDVPPEQRWRRGDRLRVAWTRIRLVGANQDTLTVVYANLGDRDDIEEVKFDTTRWAKQKKIIFPVQKTC
jgi:hypothetical protein